MQHIIHQNRHAAYAKLEGESNDVVDDEASRRRTNDDDDGQPPSTPFPYDFDSRKVDNSPPLRSLAPIRPPADHQPSPLSSATSLTNYYYDESNKNSSARNSIQQPSSTSSSSSSRHDHRPKGGDGADNDDNSLLVQVEKQWRDHSSTGAARDDDADNDDDPSSGLQTPKYGAVPFARPVYASSPRPAAAQPVLYDQYPPEPYTGTNSSVVAVSSQSGAIESYDQESGTFDYAGKTRDLRASFETLTNDDDDDNEDQGSFMDSHRPSRSSYDADEPFVGGFFSKSNPNAFKNGHPVTTADVTYPPASSHPEVLRAQQRAQVLARQYQQESYRSTASSALPQYSQAGSRHSKSTSDLTLRDADAESLLDRKGKDVDEEEARVGRDAGPTSTVGITAEQAAEEYDEFLISYKPTDPQHPYSWTSMRKWSIIAVICTASLCVTATSSIQASTYNSIQAEFGIERVTAVTGVSLYVLGFGIGACKWFRRRVFKFELGLIQHRCANSVLGAYERVLRKTSDLHWVV